MSSPNRSLARSLRSLALLLGLSASTLVGGCGVAGSGASSASPSVSPSSATSLSTGALEGQVVARATCGAQNPVATCTPAPVVGEVVIVRTTSGAVVAMATTDADGRFRLTLAPGHYLAQARSGSGSGAATTAAVSVTVAPGRTTAVQLVASSPPRP